MKQEIIELRKLTADEGMILYNGKAFGKEVFLGQYDQPDNWKEITEADSELIYEQLYGDYIEETPQA